MNNDVTTLQVIADTLEHDPMASQRVLAQNAGMSIGLMNAVLKRFVERGWIMLTNVNLRKLSYAITPAGITELRERSQGFARRTFEIANKYNDTLCQLVAQAKQNKKSKLVLYGQSYIKFMLVYACQTQNFAFEEKPAAAPIEKGAFCVAGEQCEPSELAKLKKQGCMALLDLLQE
ncbi:MAG: winged helix-turn-helix transcriptional regulator [Treponema sp.]|nr:winged helix-turn-helix transcriptional regulator [Treponema sp.]